VDYIILLLVHPSGGLQLSDQCGNMLVTGTCRALSANGNVAAAAAAAAVLLYNFL
jgi:hypothetical protein